MLLCGNWPEVMMVWHLYRGNRRCCFLALCCVGGQLGQRRIGGIIRAVEGAGEATSLLCQWLRK